MAEFYCAKEAFAFTSKSGLPRIVTPGQIVSDDDPDFKGKEHFFEKVRETVNRANQATETASAAPGEKRAWSRLKKSEKEAEFVRQLEEAEPQGAKNFEDPPQAVDGPEPEKPEPPTTGEVNFDPKPQSVDGGEPVEAVEPQGEKNDDPKPQAVDGGEPKQRRGRPRKGA